MQAWSQVGGSGSSQWSGNSSGPIYYNSGNVGIGASSPAAPLEINKNQNAGTSAFIDNGYTTTGNGAYSGLWFRQGGTNRFAIDLVNDGNTAQTGGPGAVQFWNFANGPMLFATNSIERLRLDAAGNVGIGTTSPTSKLQVESSNATLISANVTSGYGDFSLASAGTSKLALGYVANYSNYGAQTIAGDVSIKTNNTNLHFVTGAGNANTTMYLSNSGNVGIGTSTPGSSYKLDIAGNVNASGLCIAGTCKTDWSQVGGGGSSPWQGSGPIYYNSGSVGIGTSNPGSNLQIGAQTSGSTPTPVTLSLGGSFSNSAGSNLKLKLYDDGVVSNTYGIGVSFGAGYIAVGFTDPKSPYVNAIAYDYGMMRLSPNQVLRLWVYELGNALSFVTRTSPELPADVRATHEGLSEPGAALEDCVFNPK